MMSTFKIQSKAGIEDVDIAGKRVFIRVDYNVPISNGIITDKTRIVSTIPTIKYCLSRGCSVILASHLGRPDGQYNYDYSLQPVAIGLEILLERQVTFVGDCMGEEAEQVCKSLKPGEVVLLENLRFYPEEEGSGKDSFGRKVVPTSEQVAKFRKALTSYGEVYINDAFGTAHRAHSSIVGVDLPIKAAGLLMKKEMSYFQYVLENPPRPFVAIMGGAKVKDKIQIIYKMLDMVDSLIIGGGMAYTFLKVLNGTEIGQSLFDIDGAKVVKKIVEKADSKGIKIHFPVDFIVADDIYTDAKCSVCTVEEGIKDDLMGLDIGPKTVELYTEVLSSAKLVLFNGPMGVFEVKPFEEGTKAIINALVKYTSENGLISVIGGGDSAAACSKFEADKLVSHVSTGGGASLELLEGKVLPGLEALSDK